MASKWKLTFLRALQDIDGDRLNINPDGSLNIGSMPSISVATLNFPDTINVNLEDYPTECGVDTPLLVKLDSTCTPIAVDIGELEISFPSQIEASIPSSCILNVALSEYPSDCSVDEPLLVRMHSSCTPLDVNVTGDVTVGNFPDEYNVTSDEGLGIKPLDGYEYKFFGSYDYMVYRAAEYNMRYYKEFNETVPPGGKFSMIVDSAYTHFHMYTSVGHFTVQATEKYKAKYVEICTPTSYGTYLDEGESGLAIQLRRSLASCGAEFSTPTWILFSRSTADSVEVGTLNMDYKILETGYGDIGKDFAQNEKDSMGQLGTGRLYALQVENLSDATMEVTISYNFQLSTVSYDPHYPSS